MTFSVIAAIILCRKVGDVYPKVAEEMREKQQALKGDEESGSESEGEGFELPRRGRGGRQSSDDGMESNALYR